MNRISGLLVIALFAAIGPIGSHAYLARFTFAITGQEQSEGPLAITHGPYLQLPTATAMTIVWHTNRKCVSRVEFGTGSSLDLRAVSSRYGLIDNHRTSYIVRLSGLKPGTAYQYRVVSTEFIEYEKQHIVKFGDTVSSEVSSFTTLDPAKKSFAFAMVSDTHERAEELETMMSEESWEGVDFVLYNGDMINDFMSSDQIFTGFLDVLVKKFAKKIPFVFSRGNHETRGRFARNIPDYIPSVDGRAYYSFDHGRVHFIVLDSGEDKEDEHEYYNGLVDFVRYRKEQAEWLKRDLGGEASKSAEYKIVISHIPPRGARGYGALSVQEHFEPIVNSAGVDLWLSGHTHRLMHLDPKSDENGYHLIIAPLHATTRVDVSQTALKVTMYRVGEEILKELVIEH